MNYKISLLGAIFAGLLAGGLTILCKKIEPKIPFPAAETSETRYEKSALIRVASAFIVVSWISIIFLIFGLIFELKAQNLSFFLFWLPVFLISVLTYISICPFLKCESCGRSVTVQWFTTPPFIKKMWGIEGWAVIILQVLIFKRFTCMYCGKNYSIK